MSRKSILLFSALGIMSVCTCKIQAMDVTHAHNSLTNEEDNVPVSNRTIDLHGSLILGTGPNGIRASFDRNTVCVCFSQSCGNVSIGLYNGSGLLVYSTIVDTAVQQTVIIPMMGGTEGTYSLVLDNADGFAEGEFRKDNN